MELGVDVPAVLRQITVNAVALTNTAVPAISGTATVGQEPSSTTGTWDADPSATYAYEWQRCASSDCIADSQAVTAA